MKKIYLLLLAFALFSTTAQSQLTGMNPNQAVVGTQQLTTTISSNGLFVVMATQWGNLNEAYLYQAATQINLFNLFSGSTSAVITHTDSCTISNINIPINVPTGFYNLVVKTQDNLGVIVTQDTLLSAFTVLPPDGYIQGNVFEDANLNKQHDFNEYGVYDVALHLQPGNQYYYTDSSGNYSLPLSNGTYTLTWANKFYDMGFLSTDSPSYTITVNNANVTGLDFGMYRGLTALAPSQSIAGRTVNFTATSRNLFTSGTGGINYVILTKAMSIPAINYYASNIQVVNNNTITFSVNIPANAVTGNYDLRVGFINGNYYHFLHNCFNILPYDAFLEGNIYFDMNGNGLKDTLEPGLPNERVNIVPDSGAGFSSLTGDYLIGVLNGSHTVAWTPSPTNIFNLHLSSGNASYSVNNTGTITGLDFGLSTTNPDYSCDVLLTVGRPRCNSNAPYYLYYVNKSNHPFDGRVYLVKDPITTYYSATVPPSGFSGDTIFWNYSNLQPFTPMEIHVRLSLPASGVIQITAGQTSTDGSGVVQFTDVASAVQTIGCSFDPNDKSVTPEGSGPEHFTLMNDWLEYLVRFQNTGTDTAFDVTIYDHLGNDLDLNTFELLGSSHPVTTEIKHNGEAIFKFAHIMLPDSNVDEPNSHGFVKYRIKMKPNVSDFTTVENTAFIVFDQNSPVVTNTTSNLMVTNIPVGLFETVKSTGQAMIYPNPFSETALLIFNNENHSSIRFELRDVLGKLVRTDKSNGEEIIIRRNNLSTGVYFYRLINPDGKINSTGKMVIR